MPTHVTAIVISQDASSDLSECLAQLDFCSEIFVVSSVSPNSSIKWVNCDGQNLGQSQNIAREKSMGDWTLWIKPGEIITSDLKSEIIQKINESSEINGYFLPFSHQIGDKILRSEKQDVDSQMRLARKSKSMWTTETETPVLMVEHEVEWLENSLIVKNNMETNTLDNPKPKSSMFSLKWFVIQILKFGFVTGVLYWMWSSGKLDFKKTLMAFNQTQYIVPGFLILSLPWGITAYRLKLLLKGQDIDVSYLQALRLTFIGMFFNTSLPGAISGDVVKGYYLFKITPGLRKTQAITAMLVDRFVGLSGLIFVSAVVIAFNLETILENPNLAKVAALVSLMGLGVIGFYAFVFFPFPQKIVDKAQGAENLPMGTLIVKFFNAIRSYKKTKYTLFGSFGLSIIVHCCSISSLWFLSHALGDAFPNFLDLFILSPIGLTTIAIPIAPAGIGVGHAAFQYLYGLVGYQSGGDLFSLFALWQIFGGLSGSIPYLLSKDPNESFETMAGDAQI